MRSLTKTLGISFENLENSNLLTTPCWIVRIYSTEHLCEKQTDDDVICGSTYLHNIRGSIYMVYMQYSTYVHNSQTEDLRHYLPAFVQLNASPASSSWMYENPLQFIDEIKPTMQE